ncbi:MAG TPA: sporulation protein YqfD [Oscillospiraceae bacterium]|nr:sporulation protein YqfD [Oscillospiraceae bacterium]
MILQRLADAVFGYVTFEAEGIECARLISRASKRGIVITDPRIDGLRMTGNVRCRHYKELGREAVRLGIRLRIRKKVGLVFVLRKSREKAGLAVGMILAFLMIALLGTFVWEIDVKGIQTISESAVLAAAKASGLAVGKPSTVYPARRIEADMLALLDDVAWLSVNIQGSRAVIVISERSPEPVMYHDDDEPVNIVAKRGGVIRRTVVSDGLFVKEIGKSVAEGDLLVSGVIEDEYMRLTLKHARAKIFAETDYEITTEFPLEQVLSLRGDKADSAYLLTFLGREIPLPFGSIKNEPYYLKTEEKDLFFFDIQLPISLTEYVFFDVKQKYVTYDELQAKDGAMELLEAKEAQELGEAEILSRELFGSVNDGVYVLRAEYICIMDIAEEEPILSDVPWENTDSMS